MTRTPATRKDGPMDDLMQWLRAQLDEDERIARAATPGPWQWRRENAEPWNPKAEGGWLDYSGEYIAGPGEQATLFGPGMTPHADAVHIAAHDPARVLREIDAKRQIIEQHERYAAERRRMMGGWDPQSDDSPILAALATVYADRPGYREHWRP